MTTGDIVIVVVSILGPLVLLGTFAWGRLSDHLAHQDTAIGELQANVGEINGYLRGRDQVPWNGGIRQWGGNDL